MWVFVTSEGKVYKYNTAGTLQSGFPMTLSAGVEGAVFDGTYIWASTFGSNGYYALARINVTTKAVTQFTTVTPSIPSGIQGSMAFDGRYLWVARNGFGLAQIDSTTGAVVNSDPSIDGGNGVDSLAFDGQFLWIAAQDSNLVIKLNVSTYPWQIVKAFPVVDPHAVAYDGAMIWAAGRSSSLVTRIDARAEQIVDSIPVAAGTNPTNLAYDGTHMWLTCNGNGSAGSGAVYKFLAHF
jgi:hypothetical protein